jgi:heat-inducible transcriptional repressor
METLTERERRILELILFHYIQSAEPIGSRTIEKLMKNRLSSATIRNVMADLEEKGFIFKPHVVAGRIPTTKAFRYYVDSMLTLREPGKKTIQAIDTLHKPRYFHIERLMGDASRVLAQISEYTSIVVEPRVETMMFKELEFVKLSSRTILIVFVTSAGMVHTRLVDTEEDLDTNLLASMKRYMNERFSGKPFYLLKDAIVEDMHKDRESVNLLLAGIKETLDTIVYEEAQRDVYIEGTSRMIAFPEFSDIEKLKELFRALEKKEKLIRLLDHCLKDDGINVIIGIESDIKEMRGMSVIASAYRVGEKSFGILGVIGPVRMDYSKVIPIVNYTAKAVTDILSVM